MKKQEKIYLSLVPAAEPNYGYFPSDVLLPEGEEGVLRVPLQSINPSLSDNKDRKFCYTVPVKSKLLPVVNPTDVDFKNMKLVVFDLETTGLMPLFDEITEIGAKLYEFKNGELVKTEDYQKFGKTSFPIREKIKKLTHITDEMIAKGGVSQKELLENFFKWCGLLNKDPKETSKVVLAGHNIIKFDIPFILKQAEKLQLPWVAQAIRGYFDTLPAAKIRYNRKKNTLQVLCDDGLSLSEDNLKDYIAKAKAGKLSSAVKDEKLILDNLDEFLKIVNKKNSMKAKIKELSNHNIFKQLQFTYDPKFQHRAGADAILNGEVIIQQFLPYFEALGLVNFIDVNNYASKSLNFISQLPPSNVVVYCDDQTHSKLIEEVQYNKSIDLDNINRSKMIISNDPSSPELINSATTLTDESLEKMISQYDFIMLPPPSFWANLLGVKTQTKCLDLESKTERFLYEHRKELAKLVSGFAYDDEKLTQALKRSSIFGKLSYPAKKKQMLSLCSKIRFLIDSEIELEKDPEDNKVYLNKLDEPNMTIEQLHTAYSKLISTAQRLGVKVVIDNDVYAPEAEDMDVIKQHWNEMFEKPFRRFTTSSLPIKFYKRSPEAIRKELSFLGNDQLIEDLTINNASEIYEKIKKIYNKKQETKKH